LLILDEPTEGIQPSIIKDIERVLRLLADRGDMAIVLVEQYFEFARSLADRFLVLDRGRVVLSGEADDMVEADVRSHLTI
jgi:urea transport system ATP-binding protein